MQICKHMMIIWKPKSDSKYNYINIIVAFQFTSVISPEEETELLERKEHKKKGISEVSEFKKNKTVHGNKWVHIGGEIL